jgi:flagellar hook-basal body complex protein FliE
MDTLIRLGPNRAQVCPARAPASPRSDGFGEALKTWIRTTAEQMREADQKTAEFAVGKRFDIHDIVISSEKTGIQFSLLMNIRNKLLEAYQEIMRMQF